MIDRDRLIEILEDTLYEWECDVSKETVTEIAEHLIENGVIVPPCNVGDHVFVVYGLGVQHTSVFSMKIESEDAHVAFILKCMVLQGGARFEEFLFGKTAFLTREEAERALKNRSCK